MAVEPTEKELSNGKRRRFQFGVRTLLVFAALVAFCLSGITWWQVSRAWRTVRYVRNHVPNVKRVSAEADLEESLAGHYDDTSHVLGGGLSGSDLYLFSDKTYYYLTWADIWPLTIEDKGTWRCRDGFLLLESDGSTPAPSGRFDRELLPLLMSTDRKSAWSDPVAEPMDILLLLGTDWDYSYFRDELQEGDEEFMLRLCTFGKVEDIPASETPKLKSELYKECWRPESLK